MKQKIRNGKQIVITAIFGYFLLILYIASLGDELDEVDSVWTGVMFILFTILLVTGLARREKPKESNT